MLRPNLQEERKMYHFDEGIERRGTSCVKWDESFVGKDVLPMWVADMDFEIAPAITKRLNEVAEKGVFGYQFLSEEYYHAVIRFMKERHNYEVEKDWIVYLPDVVTGLHLAVCTFSEPGDEIILMPPVYGPFFRVIEENDRVIRECWMKNENGYYTMDYEQIEASITEKTKAVMLCNPHNPAGRVWKEEELQRLAEICAKHNLPIISDDIHCDILSKDHKHTMVANICRKMGVKCITLTSPSKPYNLASIHVANAIIEDAEVRAKFQDVLAHCHVSGANAFSEAALVGAYDESREWLDEMNAYVEANHEYFVKYIEENIPVLKTFKPEGTYLIWVDFTGVEKVNGKPKEFLDEYCKILVNDGEFFGKAGKGFVRFNLACPRKYVEKALGILKEWFA